MNETKIAVIGLGYVAHRVIKLMLKKGVQALNFKILGYDVKYTFVKMGLMGNCNHNIK